MSRLFFAVETPPEVKRELTLVQEKIAELLGDAKGVKRENLSQSHCTIRFLGEVVEQKIASIVSSVRTAFDNAFILPFDISTNGLGVFGGWSHARVLWAGLGPEPLLQQIRHSVDSALANLGIEPEDKPFHPHLTLVRFKIPLRISETLKQEVLHLGSELRVQGEARELILFRSELTSAGAIHTPLERFIFGSTNSLCS